MVYDDYGHHPTEIDKTLRALRAAKNRFGTVAELARLLKRAGVARTDVWAVARTA